MSGFLLLLFCCADFWKIRIRRRSVSSTKTHHNQRELLFLKKPTITIVNPKNGTVTDKATINVDVQYGKSKFILPSKKFSKVELLMDGIVVAKQADVQKVSGQVTFAINLTNVTDGFHTLKAQGVVGFRGQMIMSQAISINIESVRPNPPQAAPVVPTFGPTVTPLVEQCNPEKSFLYFTGHDEASSISRGQVNITWSPAITYSTELQKFLWCGNFTYDVFVAQGGFDFLGANISGPNLIALANTTVSNMMPKKYCR